MKKLFNVILILFLSSSLVFGFGGGSGINSSGTTGAVKSISYPHHEVHSGSHYFVKGYTTLDSGNDIDFCVVTPDTTKWAHMTFSIASTAQTTIEIYEDVTFSDAGAAVTAYNNNRNSANTTGLTIASERTIEASGTMISQTKFGTGTNPSKIAPGQTEREDEIILKQNTGYVFRFISGTDGNIIDYRASWYEHTDK